MGIAEIERDLKIIRKIMESSSRYTNIPASGYLVTGVLGLLGAWGTSAFLGKEKVADMTLITSEEMMILAILWLVVFVAALGTVMFFSWRKARKHNISAWNSLAARMVFSQVPVVIVTGILTLAMVSKGYYDLIPGTWLGIYGTVLYSFSYFTSFEHKIEGGLFIILGILAVFAPSNLLPMLLGVGFGGIHIMAGMGRLFIKKGQHASKSVE